jgi:serine/threonine-protein kinase HipA
MDKVQLRTVLAKESKIQEEDSFGLLAHFGAESAGSLVLRSPNDNTTVQVGLSDLPDEVLSQRIKDLPRLSLNHDSPKHMSLAGAQHKLAVVFRNGRLFEPLLGEASTHILKPNHQGNDYPSSVINEYFVMLLAQKLGLNVPNVHRYYTPEAVYIVDRFDRTELNESYWSGSQRRSLATSPLETVRESFPLIRLESQAKSGFHAQPAVQI